MWDNYIDPVCATSKYYQFWNLYRAVYHIGSTLTICTKIKWREIKWEAVSIVEYSQYLGFRTVGTNIWQQSHDLIKNILDTWEFLKKCLTGKCEPHILRWYLNACCTSRDMLPERCPFVSFQDFDDDYRKLARLRYNQDLYFQKILYIYIKCSKQNILCYIDWQQ